MTPNPLPALALALLIGGAEASSMNSSRLELMAFAHAEQRVIAIDGDTLDISGERIRLRSAAGPIDAPELRSAKCPLELFRAEAARDRLRALMAPNDFSIDRRGHDRYGRTVGIVYSVGEDVGARLVAEGHARPWPGLRRRDRSTWCEPR